MILLSWRRLFIHRAWIHEEVWAHSSKPALDLQIRKLALVKQTLPSYENAFSSFGLCCSFYPLTSKSFHRNKYDIFVLLDNIRYCSWSVSSLAIAQLMSLTSQFLLNSVPASWVLFLLHQSVLGLNLAWIKHAGNCSSLTKPCKELFLLKQSQLETVSAKTKSAGNHSWLTKAHFINTCLHLFLLDQNMMFPVLSWPKSAGTCSSLTKTCWKTFFLKQDLLEAILFQIKSAWHHAWLTKNCWELILLEQNTLATVLACPKPAGNPSSSTKISKILSLLKQKSAGNCSC